MFENEFKHSDFTPEIFEVRLKLLIKSFILENLRNSKLSTDTLAKRFHCSRATLYRLFQTHGGVARYINLLRLQRCYKHLVSHSVKRGEIGKIAKSWGFSSQQQFTRQFRQHFGVTPSDVVMGGADQFIHKSDCNSSEQDIILDSYKLASWFKELGYVTKSQKDVGNNPP